jgi:hypothetical protein
MENVNQAPAPPPPPPPPPLPPLPTADSAAVGGGADVTPADNAAGGSVGDTSGAGEVSLNVEQAAEAVAGNVLQYLDKKRKITLS